MSTKFIYINNIKEIDPSKATVFDLNKRYIDNLGNMYGLRYNRATKKVEIIKLLRTSSQHADRVQKKMVEQKRSELISEKASHSVKKEENVIIHNEDSTANQNKSNDNEIIPEIFIKNKLELIKTHKSRLEGLIFNLNNSNVINHDDREIATTVQEIIRNMDIDCIQKIDKVDNLYKELTEYPRGISYYVSRFDNYAKDTIDNLYSDERKMEFVIYYEMNENFKETYHVMDNLLVQLLNFLKEISGSYISKLNSTDKQHYSDSILTIENTQKEIKEVLNQLTSLDDYLSNPNNFQS